MRAMQMGLLVATLQLDVSLLMQAFDLGFCDAFVPSDVYDDCEAAAKGAATAKVGSIGALPLMLYLCFMGHGSSGRPAISPSACRSSSPRSDVVFLAWAS